MSFSCKIILGEHVNEMGMCRVYLQAIIDRKRAKVPLGFYLKPGDFDMKRQMVKEKSNPNAKDYGAEFLKAVAKANGIASKFRQADRLLTPEEFRKEYTDPTEKLDLIKFVEYELKLRTPSLSYNTVKQHTTLINKLRLFRKAINFNHVNRELIQKFRIFLIEAGNGGSTIEKLIKILKQYLNEARKKGIGVKDIEIKIKAFRSNRNSLTEDEVARLDKYFHKADCPHNHKQVLRCFLFSCYTGLRISDIKVITWGQIHDDLLIYTPVKTKGKNEKVTVPLVTEKDRRYLPEYTHEKKLIFKTYTDQVTNRLLKDIAKSEDVKIKKNLTYHTSRHTFGSFVAETGDVVSLQKMMGHSNIQTSMEYVHTNVKQLIEVKKKRFDPVESSERKD